MATFVFFWCCCFALGLPAQISIPGVRVACTVSRAYLADCTREKLNSDHGRIQEFSNRGFSSTWSKNQSTTQELVSWCFEPSQPQRITSGLITTQEICLEAGDIIEVAHWNICMDLSGICQECHSPRSRTYQRMIGLVPNGSVKGFVTR